MSEHELVTIAFSHYCEKARWALDRFGVPYREERYMPGLHFPAVMRRTLRAGAGRADRASTRFSTPLLRTAEGELLTDSCDIVAWVDRRYANGALHPAPDAARLERELGEQLGAHARRVVYFHLLPQRGLLDGMAERNVSRRQALVFRGVRPLVERLICTKLQVNAERAARSHDAVRRVADSIAERVNDGRPYLLGDALTAADLAFASLFAPLVSPPEYGARLPSMEELPATARALIEEMRQHPAGRLALRLYRDERHARPAVTAQRPA